MRCPTVWGIVWLYECSVHKRLEHAYALRLWAERSVRVRSAAATAVLTLASVATLLLDELSVVKARPVSEEALAESHVHMYRENGDLLCYKMSSVCVDCLAKPRLH